MLLVGDGGATKAAWLLLDVEKKKIKKKFITKGFSPLLHDSQRIGAYIKESEALLKVSDWVTEIQYFGAGCSSRERCGAVEKALQDVFTEAKITVTHDLMAAVLATCGDTDGFSCILGTGSNSCYYDGKKVWEETPALGFILGDEGSGSYLGKALLTSYFYNKIPSHLKKALDENFDLNRNMVLSKVYNQDVAKAYLASFARFLGTYKTDPFVYQLILEGFKKFIYIHICSYHNFQSVPIHFVGSIAYYFEDILRDAAALYELQIGKIIRAPIEGLADYFLNK